MYYTIAEMKDRCSGGLVFATIDKKGNEYVVSLVNKDKRETTRKTYKSIHVALEVFERYVEAFVLGLYSYEDRKSWLE